MVKRKAGKKTWGNRLDKLVSEIVRARGKCERCYSKETDKFQCCHIYSRTYRSVRWDTLNLLCLCASCHFWSHKNPILFTEFVREYLGLDNYTLLKERALPTKSWKVWELEEMYEQLSRVN